MGQRLRLKAGYVIPTNWTTAEKALLRGLKKYGAMVSDNSSSFFSISITPDDRWGSAFDHLISTGLAITNFEVIQTSGPNEGPRSPGAPTANAGPDQIAPLGEQIQLQGAVNFTGAPPAIQWKLYSGPGVVVIGDSSQTNTTVNFSAPGVYTLMMSADDGVHAIAYDAMVMTITQTISLNAARSGENVNLSWTGGTAPYVVQRADALPASSWANAITTSAQTVSIPMSNSAGFFRVLAQ